MSHGITVILGTYNQRDVLELVLQNYESQTLDKDQFEVIVVDSSSTDGTGDFVSTYRPGYNFKGIVQENRGKTAARNRAIQESQFDLILITDADMIPHPELLERHLDAHQKAGEICCFEGLTYDMTELHWPADPSKIMPYIKKDYKNGAKLGWYYFLTGNLSIPKSLFLNEGGFSELFKGYGWEDLELGYRLSLKKIPLYYLKKAKNYHYHVVSDQEIIERNVKKGESAKVFVASHPELKWFLGLNPLSVFVFRRMSPQGRIYNFIKRKCYGSQNKLFHKFGFWFLSEYSYLQGILG